MQLGSQDPRPKTIRIALDPALAGEVAAACVRVLLGSPRPRATDARAQRARDWLDAPQRWFAEDPASPENGGPGAGQQPVSRMVYSAACAPMLGTLEAALPSAAYASPDRARIHLSARHRARPPSPGPQPPSDECLLGPKQLAGLASAWAYWCVVCGPEQTVHEARALALLRRLQQIAPDYAQRADVQRTVQYLQDRLRPREEGR